MSLIRQSLLLACFISVTIAWVPRLENRSGRKPFFAEVNGENVQAPERISTLESEPSIFFDDLLFYPYHHQVQDILDSVSERADELATATFAAYGKQEPELCMDGDCDGEQECLIPEEWVLALGEIDTAEVLNFLGVRRLTVS
jgi:hypothetical protein